MDSSYIFRGEVQSDQGTANPGVEAVAGDGADAFLMAPQSELGKIVEQVRRVAAMPTTILLGGETGTGKTRMAKLIHDLSPRKDLPFLVVNCGALSSTLIESEMFGHIRGAFTGADRDRLGKFEEVGGGTLLLDDIDVLPLETQAKLLRVVEDRMFEAVGCNRTRPLNARIIVASNRPLEGEVAAGRFRSDLYHRLNVVSFQLPPLRHRPESVVPLAEHYAAEFAAKNGRLALTIAPDAARAMRAHSWPGNVRELRNVVERAVVLGNGREIVLEDLPEPIRRVALPPTIPARYYSSDGRSFIASLAHATQPPMAAMPSAGFAATPATRIAPMSDVSPRFDCEGVGNASSLARAKSEAEALRILQALQKHNDNRLRAAMELGISRMTLYKKMDKYGIHPAPSRFARITSRQAML